MFLPHQLTKVQGIVSGARMSDDNHSSESHLDEDEEAYAAWEAWEIATLALLPSMPQEI
jgi:hypothetical protein